ncbi:hypothetical protein [Pelagicoccus mobilis]|uniref:TonB C-terminal domain-containing protein n=1 Tax=Pelagicoccus mobilis TaxID=415221 RepID=A0A934VP67_9BACT|nr:hypothetical protein [Pelagicoccus mobilis]MBK1876967.1 hypothetical protein [Pelagicoccus mobilis]
MLSYPMSLPAQQVFRRYILPTLLSLIGFPLSAQHQLSIPNPVAAEEKLGVLALNDSLCVVDLGFGIESVASNAYYFEAADSYADGFLEINRPVGNVIREGRKATFDFSVKVRPSRNYTDCFVVLRLFTQDGREFLLPFEIDDLKEGKADIVRITPTLVYDDLNKGVYHYHFFSGGREIYYAPTQFQLGKKRLRPLALRGSGSREPEIDRIPDGGLPKELSYLVSGEEVLVAVGVNDNGYSVDHTVLSDSDPMAGQLALKLVKNARFKPGSENGFFARKDLLLRVQFDSRGHYQMRAE